MSAQKEAPAVEEVPIFNDQSQETAEQQSQPKVETMPKSEFDAVVNQAQSIINDKERQIEDLKHDKVILQEAVDALSALIGRYLSGQR